MTISERQAHKVYAAEDALRSMNNRYYQNIRDIQEWVNQIVASKWWDARYPHITRIKVIDPYPHNFARGTPGSDGVGAIALPTWARFTLFIIHEIAHVVSVQPGHSSEFCVNYIALVRRWLGEPLGQALIASFDEFNVWELCIAN